MAVLAARACLQTADMLLALLVPCLQAQVQSCNNSDSASLLKLVMMS